MTVQLHDPAAARLACSALAEMLRVLERERAQHPVLSDVVCAVRCLCAVCDLPTVTSRDFAHGAARAHEAPVTIAGGLFLRVRDLLSQAYLFTDEDAHGAAGRSRAEVEEAMYAYGIDALCAMEALLCTEERGLHVPDDVQRFIDARWPA